MKIVAVGSLLALMFAAPVMASECLTGFDGRITDIHGKGVEGVPVRAYANGKIIGAQSDTYGYWRITGAQPGQTYTILGPREAPALAAAKACKVSSVALQDPWIADDRQAEDASAIYGRLLSDEGKPQRNRNVVALHPATGNFIASATTDCGWFFMPNLRAGDGRYDIQSLSHGRIEANPAPATAVPVDLNNGAFPFDPKNYNCRNRIWPFSR